MQKPPVKKKEPKRELHCCILCGWQDVCTEKEFINHIAGQHEHLYVPRQKKSK